MHRETFDSFYRETASALRAYLRLRCRNSALADDLLQETYLRVLRQPLPELETGQLRAYLYKSAHSVLADHYRALRRERQWVSEHTPQSAADSAEASNVLALDRPAASDPLELPADMQRIFATLKARQKALLWLAYVEGFTHQEIAAVIGVNASSVRVLLSRARAKLAEKLGDQDAVRYAARKEAK